MITGWWHNDYYDDWYYYDESGKMLKTSLAYKGVTYYFDPETGKCLNKDGDKVSEFVLAYRNWQIKHDKFIEDNYLSNKINITTFNTIKYTTIALLTLVVVILKIKLIKKRKDRDK